MNIARQKLKSQFDDATKGIPTHKGLTTPLWEMKREDSQLHIKDLLEFLIWGQTVPSMSERLWMVTTDHKWRYDHFGRSSLGEAVGWARPDLFPPRNNRTNKALRALGHDVTLFSE